MFRSLAVLPLWFLHALGAMLGWITFLASPTYRRRFIANARQAGYSFSQVRRAISETGKSVAELPRLWFGRPMPVQWDGHAVIEAAIEQRRGILFLTPHLGCYEVTAQALAERYGPLTVLYRPARKAWLRDLMDTARARGQLATAPTTLAGVKQMLKALKAGQAVGLLPDQVPPQGLGAWAPFFGREAYTMTLPARLAQKTGATVLLLWGERLSWGRGVRLHFRGWPGAALDADAISAAAQINARMEEQIRQCPGQYLWGYARYKSPRQDVLAAAAVPADHARSLS